MNPAMLNYLQSQQQQYGLQNDMSNEPPAEGFNPFDSGIRKAIDSARESLGMTEKQQDKAMRRSMLSFAANIATQPKQKGFFNNFGSVSRAMTPAIMEYDNAEDQYENQNNIVANQLLAHKAAQEKTNSSEAEQSWRQDMDERKLAEHTRLHDLQAQYNQAKLQKKQPQSSTLGDGFIPIESNSERLMYSKDKKASGEILHELDSITKDYNEFKDLTKDDLIHPMTPYGIGTAANTAKDFFSYFSDNKKNREQTVKRKALDAKLGKFQAELERKLKGGMLTKGMIELFEKKDLLPSLTNAPDIFEQKLANLTEEMQERYTASDASLRYGVHVSPYDLKDLEDKTATNTEDNLTADQGTDAQLEEYIKIRGPSGRIEDVHINDVELLDPAQYTRVQ